MIVKSTKLRFVSNFELVVECLEVPRGAVPISFYRTATDFFIDWLCDEKSGPSKAFVRTAPNDVPLGVDGMQHIGTVRNNSGRDAVHAFLVTE